MYEFIYDTVNNITETPSMPNEKNNELNTTLNSKSKLQEDSITHPE